MTLVEGHTDLAPADLAVADLGVGSGPAWLDSWLAEHPADVVAWRRSLHAVPELARGEHRTTSLVSRMLMNAGLEPRTLAGGTGLVCDIGYGERCVALRADMDALPLTEDTGLPFASTVHGVMHACGHDAHTAMLLGAGARAGVRAGAARAGAADLPAGRGGAARRGDGRGRRRRDGRRGADLRAALRPAAGGRQGRHPGRPDHVRLRPAGAAAHLAGRAHLAAPADRRPGARARPGDHRSCRRCWPGRSTRARAPCSSGVRCGPARRPTRSPSTGCCAGPCARPTTRRGASWRRWSGSRRGAARAHRRRVRPRAHPRRAAGGERGGEHPHARRRRRDGPRARRRCGAPSSPAAARTSPGTSSTCRARWPGSACGPATARCATSTSPRSTSTSAPSRSGSASWSTRPWRPSPDPTRESGRRSVRSRESSVSGGRVVALRRARVVHIKRGLSTGNTSGSSGAPGDGTVVACCCPAAASTPPPYELLRWLRLASTGCVQLSPEVR